MALVRPSAGTADVQDTPSGVVITIPAPRHKFGMLFLPLWLVAWTFGEISAIGDLLGPAGDQPIGFLVFWLAGWTVGGVFALGFFLWMLRGRQIIRVERGLLSLRWDVFGLGYSREYEVSRVANLRIGASSAGNPFGVSRAGAMWVFTCGPMAFDYGAHTIHFGLAMHEAEAATILPRLSRLLPRGSAA